LTQFSVIIPVATLTPQLERTREQIAKIQVPLQVILVVSKSVKRELVHKFPHETVTLSQVTGRGFALAEGLSLATGEIIIFLHADTSLPEHWEHLVHKVMNDHRIVGGAFALAFDRPHFFLDVLIFFSNLLFHVNGELWGDRAIFIRSEIIKSQPSLLQVPIMEDVRLSHYMKRRGKVVLLTEKVITSAQTFFEHGMIKNTLRILYCRAWYALGGNLNKIYAYYYQKLLL